MSDERAEVRIESQGELLMGRNIEIITDQDRVKEMEPLITIRAILPGHTEKIFIVKINQPSGRALLLAVHL
jgi:hypothetical protein